MQVAKQDHGRWIEERVRCDTWTVWDCMLRMPRVGRQYDGEDRRPRHRWMHNPSAPSSLPPRPLRRSPLLPFRPQIAAMGADPDALLPLAGGGVSVMAVRQGRRCTFSTKKNLKKKVRDAQDGRSSYLSVSLLASDGSVSGAGGGPSPSLMSPPSRPPLARIPVLPLLIVVRITALLQHGLERPPPQPQLQGL